MLHLLRNFPRPRLLLQHTLVLLTAMIFLVGCEDDLPQLKGTNETFVTSGSADDGDDQTTPPQGGAQYINPDRSATDGGAKAVSDPKSFVSLSGEAVAATGPQATRNSGSISTNKVTSSFVVEKATALKFKVTSSASANLNNGRVRYQFVVRILNAQGVPVQGTDYQSQFQFSENANGKNDVSQDNQPFTQIADGDPIQSEETGPRNAFTLQPATYTLLFELNVSASTGRENDEIVTPGKAEIKASASVELLVP